MRIILCHRCTLPAENSKSTLAILMISNRKIMIWQVQLRSTKTWSELSLREVFRDACCWNLFLMFAARRKEPNLRRLHVLGDAGAPGGRTLWSICLKFGRRLPLPAALICQWSPQSNYKPHQTVRRISLRVEMTESVRTSSAFTTAWDNPGILVISWEFYLCSCSDGPLSVFAQPLSWHCTEQGTENFKESNEQTDWNVNPEWFARECTLANWNWRVWGWICQEYTSVPW